MLLSKTLDHFGNYKLYISILVALLILTSCGDDEDGGDPTPTNVSTSYDIVPSDIGTSHDMRGELKIDEMSDGSSLITISINAANLQVNPVNFSVIGVPIEAVIFTNDITSLPNERESIITLNVVGTRSQGTPRLLGNSQTFMAQMDNGTTITYDELVELDAHVRLEFDGFLYGLGNIGSN